MSQPPPPVTCASLSPRSLLHFGLGLCCKCVNYCNEKHLVSKTRQALPQLSWGSKFQCDYVPLILERLQENVQEIECNGEEVGKQRKVDPFPSKRPRKSSWEGIKEHINMLEDHAMKAEAKLKNEQDC